MPKSLITVRAPSNIALLKYMGKTNSDLNLPENSSLSMTLHSLCTIAEVETNREGLNQWLQETPKFKPADISVEMPWEAPTLSNAGIKKITKHMERVKSAIPELFSEFGIAFHSDALKSKGLNLRTANTFPASSGIASSASSFAAVTLGVAAAFASDLIEFKKIYETQVGLRRALAQISRQGSGSSCRSFEGPWVSWEEKNARLVSEVNLPKLVHFVILIKTDPKTVSSSEAHRRVKDSPLWVGRVERVQKRFQKMIQSMRSADLIQVSRLAWVEFWEMHSLFHTSDLPFTYWEPRTVEALQFFSQWIEEKSPLIVTLDAGPNIHLMVSQSEQELWRFRLKKRFPDLRILEDKQGYGASIEQWSTNGTG